MAKKALTNREREVFELLLQGLTYKEIAQRIIVSEVTVKAHNCSIYAKLGAKGHLHLQALEIEKLRCENERLRELLNSKPEPDNNQDKEEINEEEISNQETPG